MSIVIDRSGSAPRRAFAAVALGALVLFTGCATKKDVRMLQATIDQMQVRQDSVLRDIQRQNRLMLDTLRSSMNLTLESRGQTSFRFQELSGDVKSTHQLAGQLLEATRQLAARMEAIEARLQSAPAQSQPTPTQSGMSATQGYQLGMTKMKEGAYGSARTYFQSVIRSYRDDPLAADAQFQIGESWVFEESYEDAYQAFEQVASGWPASERAGAALYRAGKVAQDRKDNANARKFYTRVVQLYPSSPQAKLARTELGKIPR